MVISKPKMPVVNETNETETGGSLPQNTSIEVSVKPSSKANTIDLIVSKLEKKYRGIAYEVTYETNGTYQGVNSGTKPLDVLGQDQLRKEIYLGTCSKNVCTPHTGVTAVSVVLELTDTDGNKSQYSNDFQLSSS